MTATRLPCFISIVTFLALPCVDAQTPSSTSQSSTQTDIDAAFQEFWAAGSPAEAERLVENVEKTGVTFAEALRRLKLGRRYTGEPTGVPLLQNRTDDSVEHFYAINIRQHMTLSGVIKCGFSFTEEFTGAKITAARHWRNRSAGRG